MASVVVTINDMDIELEVAVTRGRPATGPTYSCAGEPPEPDEIDYQCAWITDPITGKRLTRFNIDEYIEDADGDELERLDGEVLSQLDIDAR